MMKISLFSLLLIFVCCPMSFSEESSTAAAQQTEPFDTVDETVDFEDDAFDIGDGFDTVPLDDSFETTAEAEDTAIWADLLSSARFTLKYEASCKVEDPVQIQTHRSSLRFEYARSIGRYFYLQYDAKASLFWDGDYRAEARDNWVVADTFIREGFLQASFA